MTLLGEDGVERERLGGASGGVAHDRGEDEAGDRMSGERASGVGPPPAEDRHIFP